MKKLLVMLLSAALLVMCFAGCGAEEEKFKIGFIFLHDDKSTYDLNFMEAANATKAKLGLTDDQVIFKYPVAEGAECYNAAADLADQGCDIVFADSFGHEAYLIQAAKEFTDVQFCHATGVKAHTEGLSNYHNAFASIYEGRYLAGVVAGMKLNELISNGTITDEQAVIGYVGAFPYAEVISGYTSFYLGAKSICSSATMLVNFTNSWYDVDAERNNANALIDKGCVLMSQHADSMGAPSACEKAGVFDVSYNGSTIGSCPNTFLVSSKINWGPYFEYIIGCVQNGEAIATDWVGTLQTSSVVLTAMNENVVAPGTAEKVEEVKAKLMSGEISVYDTKTFTVGGAELTTYLADVDDFGDYVGETEVVENGKFNESTKRSAPYFALDIDGITRLDK